MKSVKSNASLTKLKCSTFITQTIFIWGGDFPGYICTSGNCTGVCMSVMDLSSMILAASLVREHKATPNNSTCWDSYSRPSVVWLTWRAAILTLIYFFWTRSNLCQLMFCRINFLKHIFLNLNFNSISTVKTYLNDIAYMYLCHALPYLISDEVSKFARLTWPTGTAFWCRTFNQYVILQRNIKPSSVQESGASYFQEEKL